MAKSTYFWAACLMLLSSPFAIVGFVAAFVLRGLRFGVTLEADLIDRL